MVLGKWSVKDTLYGDGFSVISNGDLGEQITEAIARLPSFPPISVTPTENRAEGSKGFTPPPLERHVTEGSFFVAENKAICQLQNGEAVAVVYGGTALKADGAMTGRRVAALIDLATGHVECFNRRTRAGPRIAATRPAVNSIGSMTAFS